jgi:UDP-N-acetyl-D-glucosamine dehydrogenase
MQKIVQKIKSKKAVIGVIGLGYVGLPIMIRFAEEGFKVLGFDIDLKKVKSVNIGKSYIKHIPGVNFKSLVKKERISATTDFKKLKSVDAAIICVPTPLNEMREPDLQYIEKTGEEIARNLRKGQVICLESTTYPGTTDEILLPILEKSKLKVEIDFFLVYSPEREDPGNAEFTTKTIPKIVGGITPACRKVGTRDMFYVALSCCYAFCFFYVNIKTQNFETFFCKSYYKGQAHITKSDYSY